MSPPSDAPRPGYQAGDDDQDLGRWHADGGALGPADRGVEAEGLDEIRRALEGLGRPRFRTTWPSKRRPADGGPADGNRPSDPMEP